MTGLAAQDHKLSEGSVSHVLERALEGERISDAEALTLLESRDLVAVGRVAHEIRNRKADPDRITFIIDRNLNYTNICHTDCDFCAFYRSPGDTREGYLLPKPVIFKKIEETIALGGTGLLMQGGHHPDLGIDYYEDLFSSIKARYKIHLHALSPPEVQHIARRSKLTLWQTISRLRDAGLDSIPGGGGEILVDRVRHEIAPKKTKTKEWLDVMRHAHRLGMSTTATMMYGHVETVAERVEHMRRIRDLQDETGGFRAFISWTFQNDGNRLAGIVTDGDLRRLMEKRKDATLGLTAGESMSRNPVTISPNELAGAIAGRLNELPRMRLAFSRAVGRDSRFWYAHFELGLAEAALGHRATALRELHQAAQLNPSEDVITQVTRQVLGGRPVDRGRIDRLFAERVRTRVGP